MNVKNLSLLLSTKKRFKIKNKKGQSVYFTPNSVQKKLLRYILECWSENKPVRLIIIKGRQQGVTTLFQLMALALCLKVPGFQSYTMAHDKALANDFFENKIKFAWDKFPQKFKEIYQVNRNNTRQLLFDGEMNKSSITVGLSGRGGTYQFVHISEPGKMSQKEHLWNEMLEGTLPAGEFADMIAFESTADGGLGPFYKLVQENLKPNSKFKVVFLSWIESSEYLTEPPIEDSSWKIQYRQYAQDYDLCINPVRDFGINDSQFYWYFLQVKTLREKVKTQYPFSIDEAFISLAQNFFNLRIIQRAEDKIDRNEAEGKTYSVKQEFKIWKQPVTGHKYAIGIDCSTGEADDSTSIQVFDALKGEQVAEATGKYTEEMTAIMAANVGYFYNNAYIGVEINNMGRAVLNFIIKLEYPDDRIYRRFVTNTDNPRLARIPKLGWQTSSSSRPVLITEFRTDFEDGTLTINSRETLAEFKVFVNNNGKYEAQVGFHDDRAIACMIAKQVISYIVLFG